MRNKTTSYLCIIGCVIAIGFLLHAIWITPPIHHGDSLNDIAEKVKYNSDSSMTFGRLYDNVTFTESELPELMLMFIKADELDKECKKTIKIDTDIDLGTIDNHEFKYHYSHFGYSMILVSTGHDVVGIWQNDCYMSYFTKYKVEHDKQMEELNKIKTKLNIK